MSATKSSAEFVVGDVCLSRDVGWGLSPDAEGSRPLLAPLFRQQKSWNKPIEIPVISLPSEVGEAEGQDAVA